ncbi:MAG: hypothetical protein JO222_09285 [Frankiales bacterium]|nr:hypothetical protein [Frankiales bacterium]
MANTPIPVAVLNKILSGPGILLTGILGSALPSLVPTAGVYTDDWSAVSGWTELGPTENGSQFHDTATVEKMYVAESYYEVSNVVTGREASIDFALAHFTATNLKNALNGATVTVTGSAGTTNSKVVPPAIGTETRQMIGWESNDHTARLIAYQAFQQGAIEPEFRKGATKALIACTFHFENASPSAWEFNLAGTARA